MSKPLMLSANDMHGLILCVREPLLPGVFRLINRLSTVEARQLARLCVRIQTTTTRRGRKALRIKVSQDTWEIANEIVWMTRARRRRISLS